VGSRPEGASPFGVLDLAGNVAEWTASPMVPHPGFVGVRNPRLREIHYLEPDFDRTLRVVKGGQSYDTRELLRIDAREGLDPRHDVDAGVGFRGARSRPDGVLAALANGRETLRVTRLPAWGALDLDDVFGRAETQWDAERGVVTGFECVAFAHPDARRDTRTVTTILRESVDAPVVLGLFVTTAPLSEPALPPGAWVLAYKAAGEPEAEQDRRREARRAGREPPEPEGVEVPYDRAVILWLDRDDVVAAWTPAPDPRRRPPAPLEATWRDEHALRLAFTLDTAHARPPRFEVPVVLARDR